MRIMYLCDGNVPECKKTHCYKNTSKEACKHTSDIRHAKNFTGRKTHDGMFYKENSADTKKKEANTIKVKIVGYKKTMKRIQKISKAAKQLRDTLKEISELRKTSIF